MVGYDNQTNASLHLMLGCRGNITRTVPAAESYITSSILFLMIAISLFGNSLVITTISTHKSLQKFTNSLLCSLAVSDSLSAIFRVTFIAISNVSRRWVFGCTWCLASSQFGIFFCAVSIAHLVAITLERFVSILYPLQRDKWVTKRGLVVTIVVIWSVAVFLALLPFIFSSDIEVHFNERLFICETSLIKKPFLSVILFLVFCIIPLLVMSIVYTFIFRAAAIQARKISTYSLGDKRTKQKQLMKTEWKAVKTVVVVVGAFFVFCLPYFIVTMTKSFAPDHHLHWVDRFAYICVYLNSCCNWIIYSVMNKHFRSGFAHVLRISTRRSSTRQPSWGVVGSLRKEVAEGEEGAAYVIPAGQQRNKVNLGVPNVHEGAAVDKSISNPQDDVSVL